MNTMFSIVYERFLGKITDDMYIELTPEDTVKDLQNILINSLPGFEFPRFNLYDYTINQTEKITEELTPNDFVIKVLDNGNSIIEQSCFNSELTSEEINILAILMMTTWVQRQVTSIENTRMKYSGPDFKMTSQANHLSKMLSLLNNCQKESLHMQRLYKRRKLSNGSYQSNWSVLRENSVFDDN